MVSLNIGNACKAKTELRWMRFVDGENFVFQGSKFLESNRFLNLKPSSFIKDQFLWIPTRGFNAVLNYNLRPQWNSQRNGNCQAQEAIRAYYYTVVTGNKEQVVFDVEKTIWENGFTPRVFWKSKSQQKTKAVDSQISIDMLSAAYENQFDLVEIWTGDADYIPLVNAVKRLGKIVVCCFFDESYGLSQDLKMACDRYCNISEFMTRLWKLN